MKNQTPQVDQVAEIPPMAGKPELEWVAYMGNESIRYLQHGTPSPLIRWHHHKEYELHYIVETKGKVFVGDYIGNFYPGNLMLVGPNLPHNWITQAGMSAKTRDLVINFTHDLVERCTEDFPEMKSMAQVWEYARNGIEFLDEQTKQEVGSIMHQLADASGLGRLGRFLTILELLGSCENYRILSSNFHSHITDLEALDNLNLALNYIVDRYSKEITLEEVAEVAGMSGSYFSKFFKKITGNNFVEFVGALRINKACEKLVETSEPVSKICYSVGFGNISNFNRRFYKLKGMKPSEYRKLAGACYSSGKLVAK